MKDSNFTLPSFAYYDPEKDLILLREYWVIVKSWYDDVVIVGVWNDEDLAKAKAAELDAEDEYYHYNVKGPYLMNQ